MPDSLLSQTRRTLREHGLRARKGLAQHFLIDRGVLRKIVAAAELSPDDVVVEVGPGLGILTRDLAERAGRVIAVELDRELTAILKDSLTSFPNVSIINADILQIDISGLLQDHTKPYKVVANLPYYIAAPVLRRFLEARPKPVMVLVMVQKEVARTICAQPGDMGLLSVAVQLYGRPRIVGTVPARAFYPPPDVDSAILRIDVYLELAVPVEEKSFFVLVRAGFSAARKQIVNPLAHTLGLPKSGVLVLLGRAGIAPERRAETLSLEEWSALWRVWREREKA